MAWPELADLATGGTPTEAWYDAVRDRLNHLGSLQGALDTALEDTSFGASFGLPSPDYDSGWFAVSAASYTKAHSLAVRPTLVTVRFATSATPADSDDLADFIFTNSYGNTDGISVGISTTNVKIDTSAHTNVLSTSWLGNNNSGFARIRAWK